MNIEYNLFDNITYNFVNQFGCAIPIFQNFDIRTDLTNTDLTNVTEFEIGKTNLGKLKFTNISLIREINNEEQRLDIDSALTIEQSKITLNTTNAPELNKSATITLYNIVAKNPTIKKDGIACTECTIVSYDKETKTLVFIAPGF